jgi:hypothetical protein
MARQELPITGRARYHATRFLADCTDATERFLRAAWASGDQLVARRVPVDGLPAVVIMAAYAKDYGSELVDDFDALLERYKENVLNCSHNDKFFASCICILSERYQSPSDEAYESINVPGIYEELFT